MHESTIYDRIVDHLLRSGAVQPGDRIVETQLAARLGVSRIPVRESLGRLHGQGLLVSDGRGRGLRLRRYALDEIAQFYDFREMLEGGAAAAAARRATAVDIARLDEIQQRAATLAARGEFESPEWRDADHDLHAALAAASHNERLEQGLKLLLTELHSVFYGVTYGRLAAAGGPPLTQDASNRHAALAVREHREIIAAVRAGQADRAEQRARLHVRNAGRRLREALETIQAEATTGAGGFPNGR